jgi:molecular chaperone GrpE
MSDEEEFVLEEKPDLPAGDLSEEGEGPGLIKKLRDKLKKAVEEKQEYLEGWQRTRADFANYKREEAGLHTDKEARIKANVVEEILPLLDSLESALKSPSFQKVDAELKKGITGIYQQFLNVLKRIGVEQIGMEDGKDMLVGRPFDPYKHEALQEELVDDEKFNHTIVAVHRSGYTLGDMVIRPAQVSVGSYKK